MEKISHLFKSIRDFRLRPKKVVATAATALGDISRGMEHVSYAGLPPQLTFRNYDAEIGPFKEWERKKRLAA